ILLLGPPHIVILVVPFIDSEPAKLGWVTTIGIGATMLVMAATPIALILDVAGPPTKRISPFASVRSTVTRTTFTGSEPERATPLTALGNSTLTVSLLVPPKPFLRP